MPNHYIVLTNLCKQSSEHLEAYKVIFFIFLGYYLKAYEGDSDTEWSSKSVNVSRSVVEGNSITGLKKFTLYR